MPTIEQVKKLGELADFMEVLPVSSLDMLRYTPYRGCYAIDPGLPKSRWYSTWESATTEAKCGTSCCIAGWAAMLNKDSWPMHTGANDMPNIDADSFARFFGITNQQATHICTSGIMYSKPNSIIKSTLTPQQKATEIRSLIEE